MPEILTDNFTTHYQRVHKNVTLVVGAVFAAALIQGCSSVKPQTNHQEPAAKAASPPVKIADARFSSDTLYALLAAEIAIDRKRYDIALNNYVEHAEQTRDSVVAKRATQIARILRAHPQTLAMAELWYTLEPQDNDAAAIYLEELVHVRRLVEATDLARKLALAGEDIHFDTIALNSVKNGRETIEALLPRYAELDQTLPNDPSIKLGYSVLLQATQNYEQALKVLQSIPRNQQNDVKIRYQEVRLLEQTGKPKEALKKLGSLSKEHPDNIALRTRYARALWSSNPQQAREEIETLHSERPTDPEILYYYALLEQDAGRLNESARLYQALLKLGRYDDEAHFNLGEIYTALGELTTALHHYQHVGEGKLTIAATIKAADIMTRQGQLDRALAWIHQRQHALPGQYRPALIMLKSDLQASAGKMREAQDALSEGIQLFPDNIDLMYARALLFSRIDMLSEAESDFKRIIAREPNHAASLNALGYTLADRTDRLDEARAFIERALALEPDDPAILDSMGWVQYRLGNNKDALTHLRRAFALQIDHEIAAHLGEVLWVEGHHAEAIEVWRQGANHKPDSDILRNTLKRFDLSIDELN